MNGADVLALIQLTFRSPRDAFRALLDMNPSSEARALAFAAVVVLSLITTQTVFLGVPDEALPSWVAAMRSPVSGAVSQALSLLAITFGASQGARLFGGNARFSDALWIVTWIEFILVLTEIAVIVVSVVFSPLGEILSLASVVVFFWLITQGVMVLNGFKNTLLVLVGVIGALMVAGIVVLSILGMLGIGPAPAGAATVGLN